MSTTKAAPKSRLFSSNQDILPIVQLPDDAEQRVSGIAVLLKLSSRRGECLPDVMIDALIQVAAQGVLRQHVRDKVQPDVRPLFQGFRYLPTQGEHAVMQTRKDAVYLFMRRLNLFDELQERLFVYHRMRCTRGGEGGLRQRLYLPRIDLHGEQEIPGLIHARAGELLVLRDMEMAIEARPDFLVRPTLYGLGHHADLGIHDQLEFGALFRGDRGVIERYGVGNGHPIAVLLYDVKHPAAKRLGYGCAGKHGEKVAATKGEDAGHDGNSRGTQIDDYAHIIGKFIFIAAVNIGNRLFGRIAQGAGKLRRLEPRLIVAGDRGESEIVEAEGSGHSDLLLGVVQFPFQNEKGRELEHRPKARPIHLPLAGIV